MEDETLDAVFVKLEILRILIDADSVMVATPDDAVDAINFIYEGITE